MGGSLESRFERYSEVMVEALGYMDRATPTRRYLRGLMLPGQRKSAEPMAARVCPKISRCASVRVCRNQKFSAMPLLRETVRMGHEKLITQYS